MKNQSFTVSPRHRIVSEVLPILVLLLVLPPIGFSTDTGFKTHPVGWLRRDFDHIAFIGTVTEFETPVYGLGTILDPVSLIHFDVEERLIGTGDITQLVSYGAIWTDKEGNPVTRWVSDTSRCLYLNPGMRVIVIGSRRGPQLAKDQGFMFGGHYVVDFARLLTGPESSQKEGTLQLIDPPDWDARDFKSGDGLAKVSTRPLIIPTRPDTLTLGALKGLIQEYYGGRR